MFFFLFNLVILLGSYIFIFFLCHFAAGWYQYNFTRGDIAWIISAFPYFLVLSGYLYYVGEFGGYSCLFVLLSGCAVGWFGCDLGIAAYKKLPKTQRIGEAVSINNKVKYTK